MSDYKLKTPCADCPFRTDVKPYLRAARVASLEGDLVHRQGTFTCHKTTVADPEDDGSRMDGPKAQHCAGAMILLEKIGRPNQMMRIAHRLGMYDPDALDMNAPVYNSFHDMQSAQNDYVEPESAESPCHVSDHGCEAPAGWIGPDGVEHGTDDADYTCDGCHEPVCGSCSTEINSSRYCTYCSEEIT